MPFSIKTLLLGAALLLTLPAQAAIPVYGAFVKHTYPHDSGAFTQGLVFRDGVLYESTGQNGQSTLRRVQLETGKVLQKQALGAEYFGEGITLVGNKLIGLTWTSQVGFIYDAKTFKVLQKFSYKGEGWGLANDKSHVYMSDGSAFIRVLDPVTLAEQRRIQVLADGKPVDRLNELEWVEGQLFANVWGTDVIARIDPASGNVVGWIDLTGLLDPRLKGIDPDDVLNGIAYDSKSRRLLVTGKRWPKLFEIELIERKR